MSFLEGAPEQPDFDQEAFIQAILFVCSLPDDRRHLSKTKLNKILYYADRRAHLERGEPITGETYIRHKFGPYSRRLDDTLNQLEKQGALILREYRNKGVSMKSGSQTCPEVFTRPDLSVFDEEEQRILVKVAREIFPRDSETVSEESHDIVWRSTDPFGEIPYETAYLDVTEPDDREEIKEWARKRADELSE